MKPVKLRLVLLIGLILLIVGYTIGQLMPLEFLKPVIVTRELTVNDYYTRLISFIGTCVTILAVVVALFKEDLRKLWDKAELNISFKEGRSIHEYLDSQMTATNTYRAKKYETILAIHNSGTQAAKNCEIYLEQLQFSSTNFPTPQEIPLTGNPLQWNNNSSLPILIPATGRAFVSIVEVLSAESQPVNAGEVATMTPLPQLRIGGIENPTGFANGQWSAKFKLYSENARPIEYKIRVTWNSRWENRITEMNRCIQIDVKA